MDELRLLCAKELMEDLMNSASSSDEEEERGREMEVLTFLCAQNLLDDLMDSSSSSSSDEDDEFFAIRLSHLLEGSETLSKDKDSNTVPTKTNPEQSNPKIEIINSLLESRKKAIATVLRESINKSKEANSEICIPNSSVACDGTNFSTLFAKNKGKAIFDERILSSISENELKEYFHINRQSLTYLTDRFTSWYCQSSYQQSFQQLNIKTNILAFLWFCANPVGLKNVTRMFNATLTESKMFLNIILEFFEKELFYEVIKLPTSYIEKEAIAKEFEKIDGFPNVLGCLAVSSFSLKLPELVQTCGAPLLYIRGICDSNQKFLNIKITLSKVFENDTFLENDLPKLCFPKYHLLGDLTCLTRDHLVIPYKNRENLSEAEILFNTKLFRTHAKIKEAFGNLRKRFRQLEYLDFNNVETLSKFITACCILHNICIDRQDFYDETYVADLHGQCDSSFSSVQVNDFLQDLGLMKRHELTQIFFRTRK